MDALDGIGQTIADGGMSIAGGLVADYWPLFALLVVIGVVGVVIALMKGLF